MKPRIINVIIIFWYLSGLNSIDLCAENLGTIPNVLATRPECRQKLNEMIAEWNREDANDKSLHNRYQSALDGWVEKEPGMCSAGGPPPICPANHWIKDPDRAMDEFNKFISTIKNRREKQALSMIAACQKNGEAEDKRKADSIYNANQAIEKAREDARKKAEKDAADKAERERLKQIEAARLEAARLEAIRQEKINIFQGELQKSSTEAKTNKDAIISGNQELLTQTSNSLSYSTELKNPEDNFKETEQKNLKLKDYRNLKDSSDKDMDMNAEFDEETTESGDNPLNPNPQFRVKENMLPEDKVAEDFRFPSGISSSDTDEEYDSRIFPEEGEETDCNLLLMPEKENDNYVDKGYNANTIDSEENYTDKIRSNNNNEVYNESTSVNENNIATKTEMEQVTTPIDDRTSILDYGSGNVKYDPNNHPSTVFPHYSQQETLSPDIAKKEQPISDNTYEIEENRNIIQKGKDFINNKFDKFKNYINKNHEELSDKINDVGADMAIDAAEKAENYVNEKETEGSPLPIEFGFTQALKGVRAKAYTKLMEMQIGRELSDEEKRTVAQINRDLNPFEAYNFAKEVKSLNSDHRGGAISKSELHAAAVVASESTGSFNIWSIYKKNIKALSNLKNSIVNFFNEEEKNGY